MAQNIQGRIELFHTVDTKKPTTNDKPTKPNGNREEEKPTAPENGTNNGEENEEESGLRKLLGSASTQRRVTNLAFNAVSTAVTYQFQQQEFQARFLGDSRKAEKIAMNKQAYVNGIQFANRTISTAITAAALHNPLIYAIYAVSIAGDLVSKFVNYQQATSQYNQEREKAIFESRYLQDRLVKNVYNRRG